MSWPSLNSSLLLFIPLFSRLDVMSLRTANDSQRSAKLQHIYCHFLTYMFIVEVWFDSIKLKVLFFDTLLVVWNPSAAQIRIVFQRIRNNQSQKLLKCSSEFPALLQEISAVTSAAPWFQRLLLKIPPYIVNTVRRTVWMKIWGQKAINC